jgi:hypothetical protein
MNELWSASIILCLIVLFGIGCWIKDEYKKWKARKKSEAAKPVEGTAWIIYDSTGKKV